MITSIVVDVPREMILSIGDRGKDVIVAGLSPVNGVIIQSNLSPTQEMSTFGEVIS